MQIFPPKAWKILVVDDDEDIILFTTTVIKSLKYLDIGLDIVVAESEEKAKALLLLNSDIVLLLTDICMVDGESGFRLVQFVREELNNSNMRIILRSGKFVGKEMHDIVEKYDINDYISKIHVDQHKLFISVYIALRSYKALFDSNIAIQRWNQEYLDKKKQMELFRKFVPKALCPSDESNSLQDMLGVSEQTDFGVIFCDIRNFTTLAESMPSSHCFKFLNSYFSMVSPEVTKYGGFVYQLLGDGILAMYPKSICHQGLNLLRSANNIQDRIHIYNRGRLKAGYAPIRVGVGVNFGEVSIGISGTDTNMSATAFGATLNLAARCENFTKSLKVNIVVTEHVIKDKSIMQGFLIRPLGKVRAKGHLKMTSIYEVFNSDEPSLRDEKLQSTLAFEEAFSLMSEGKIKHATKILRHVEKKFKKDPLAGAVLELLKDPKCMYYPYPVSVEPKKIELWPYLLRPFLGFGDMDKTPSNKALS